MRIKFDKEMLIKHHYWVVAGGALVLSLAAIFLLRTAVRAGINKDKKEIQAQFDEISKAGDEVHSKAEVEVMKKSADARKAEEETVWRKNFLEQEPFIRWAASVENKFKFNTRIEAGDPSGKEKEIGKFLSAVVIQADDAALETSSETGNTFQGVVEFRDGSKMEVKGKLKMPAPEPKEGVEAKEEEKEVIWTFFPNPRPPLNVTQDDKKLNFADIQVGNKVKVTFDRGRYFQEPLTQVEQTTFRDSYYSQFDEVFRQVDPLRIDPLDYSVRGVVNLKYGTTFWPYESGKLPPIDAKFFRYVLKEKLPAIADFSELAWLAQEDLWVYKEIFRLVDQANGYVRYFEQPPEALRPKDKWVGKNAYWELEILPAGGGQATVKVSNRLQRRQPLGIYLLVWFKGTKEPQEIPVGGTAPLDPPLGERPSFISPPFVLAGDVANIEKVEQKLNWELAAVKRIDEIVIGADDAGVMAHSHRTIPSSLRAYREKKEEPKAEEGKGGPGPMGGGAPPVFIPTGIGIKGGGGKGGGAVVGIPFNKERYLEVSPQARRIPVAVTLIVDQQHFDRVQVSFTNSKLRFLTTQVLMNRYPTSLNPVLFRKGEDGGPGDKGVFPKFGGPPPGPMGGPPPMVTPFTPLGPTGMPPGIIPGMPPPMPDGIPGMPPGPGYPGSPTDFGGGRAADDNESNVEIVIYGIVTLYERYPARTTAAPAAP